MPHYVGSDLGLPCLPMTFYGFPGKNGLNNCHKVTLCILIVILSYENLRNLPWITVKTLNIGTPRPATIVVLNIKQFNFTMK